MNNLYCVPDNPPPPKKTAYILLYSISLALFYQLRFEDAGKPVQFFTYVL